MTKTPARFAFALAVLLSAARPAHAQSGGAYDLRWNTPAHGGQTFATGGVYSLGGTVGQPDAGVLAGGAYALHGGFWVGGLVPTLGVGPDAPAVPRVFAARVRGANPFTAATAIQFELPAAARVHVTLHGVDGRVVRRLLSGERAAGRHTVAWDGALEGGTSAPPGIYFARVAAGPHHTTLRLVRVR